MSAAFIALGTSALAQSDSAARVRHGYILPANVDLIIIGNPNWERWKPTGEDIEIVDALLRPELKTKRKELGLKKPCRYHRQ